MKECTVEICKVVIQIVVTIWIELPQPNLTLILTPFLKSDANVWKICESSDASTNALFKVQLVKNLLKINENCSTVKLVNIH